MYIYEAATWRRLNTGSMDEKHNVCDQLIWEIHPWFLKQ